MLYGNALWASTANLEVNSLSDIELRELVGTSNYQKTNTTSHSFLNAFAATLNLPFRHPLSMITSQLPPTTSTLETSPSTSTQASLMNSFVDWKNTTSKITVGWVPNIDPDNMIHLIQSNPAINVISPDWLTLSDANGHVQSSISSVVVSYAHEHHLKVWAMATNQFNAHLTHDVLSNLQRRTELVNEISADAKLNKLDGINLDFENLRPEDRQVFTNFAAALHTALGKIHVQLSIDVTPDIVFLKDDAAFFHAGLAANCDYLVVMAYDEHYGGEQTPGPVADIPWVETSVNDLLNTGVPADQLILGIPFYTRIWHIHPDGSVTDIARATATIPDLLATNHTDSHWDASLGVNYAKYGTASDYHEVWYETKQTLQDKLQLVGDDNLAGVAIWSLSLPNNNAWSTIAEALRQSVS